MVYDKAKRRERYLKHKAEINAKRREYYRLHKEQENAKGREYYYKNKEALRPKRRISEARYKTSEKGKESRRKNCQRPEVREKRAARMLVFQAIKKGELSRKPCEVCVSVEQVEAHHEDYSKPLSVIWLCRKCHLEKHKKSPK